MLMFLSSVHAMGRLSFLLLRHHATYFVRIYVADIQTMLRTDTKWRCASKERTALITPEIKLSSKKNQTKDFKIGYFVSDW